MAHQITDLDYAEWADELRGLHLCLTAKIVSSTAKRGILPRFAVNEIEGRIQEALRALGDPYLVKATIESSRIKSYERLKMKAFRFG
jgi:hypothetical protein